MPFLEIRNLHKTYPSPDEPLQVLRGVNLSLNQGDFAALIGASGSGKTTLLNLISAIDAPTSGEVMIDGRNITQTKQRDLVKWRAQKIGIVFQMFQLLPTMSVLQNVVAPMDLANVHARGEREDRALALLDKLGIKDQAYKTPTMLSGGQQQRVAIARALANDPILLLADELTANLDRMSADNVFNILKDVASQGTTVLMVTYDREIVKDLPLLYELHNGVVERTTLDESKKHRTDELKAIHVPHTH